VCGLHFGNKFINYYKKIIIIKKMGLGNRL
jgi:hypothetical protein